MTLRRRLRVAWDQAASAWCWFFGHPAAVFECRERGLVWICPTCQRSTVSGAFRVEVRR